MKKFISFLFINIIFIPVFALTIEDDFINSTLDKNLKIKKHNYQITEDTFAQDNHAKNPQKKSIEFDEILPQAPVQKYKRKIVIFDDDPKEIKIRIKKYYTTKNKAQEGDIIEFETVDEAKIKNKIYDKNSLVKARIETISKNKNFGVPSDVAVGAFMIDDILLSGEITKTGANRTLWLHPLATALNCFFGAGLPLMFIKGGHAKIKPYEIYTLYFTE